jgi:phage/plasmid-like protein (TIGR03299 family)
MPHEVETMAYRMRDRADVPWHQLGFALEHDATPDEMLVASGLDWTVSKRPLWTPSSATIAEDGVTNSSGLMRMSDYFALVRDSDNKILGPAGKDYVPTQNKQAFDFFRKFCDAGRMQLETAGSLQGGKQVWVLAKLGKMFTLPGGDEVHGYLLFSSPHCWGKSLVIKFVTIRIVCANTFAMAMSEAKYGKGFRMPHIRAFDAEVAHEAAISLGIANELFENFEATARKLASTKVDTDVVVRYIADVFQPELIVEQFGKSFYKATEAKQAEMLLDPTSPKVDAAQFKRSAYDVLTAVNRQPGADLESTRGTLWGAFNATTYYADHLAGRDRDNALYSSWFGPKAATKSQALKRAIQMAEVAA